jgi:hypothetical protein
VFNATREEKEDTYEDKDMTAKPCRSATEYKEEVTGLAWFELG